ncbi:PD-(D/E)XK nuclease family protein [Spiroplasma endosymbiont of Polydrusus pterygomalis]|uniref:PD-(D/E)XK nuclease family protein n=1 Tax=Spiroplasma endosymbiont of Polydrusus pterygomalis TaxID=3139327 RepID=UPI003CCB291A
MSLIFNKKTHQYFLKDKELFSVSKILDNYLGSSYDKIPKEILEPAIIKGNIVHKVAELYFKNINNDNLVKKIKDKLVNNKFNENILSYCLTLLNFLEKKFTGNLETISEQMFNADVVAGTPDLIFKNKLDLYTIIDFKTYKVMSKVLKIKAELQLTAYYWLLKNNGFDLSNINFICWVKEKQIELIKVEITKEKLHEWEMALALWKEKWHE